MCFVWTLESPSYFTSSHFLFVLVSFFMPEVREHLHYSFCDLRYYFCDCVAERTSKNNTTCEHNLCLCGLRREGYGGYPLVLYRVPGRRRVPVHVSYFTSCFLFVIVRHKDNTTYHSQENSRNFRRALPSSRVIYL